MEITINRFAKQHITNAQLDFIKKIKLNVNSIDSEISKIDVYNRSEGNVMVTWAILGDDTSINTWIVNSNGIGRKTAGHETKRFTF